MNTTELRQPTHREELERELVHGASSQIAHAPENAAAIAKGIKTVLDELAPVAPHPVAIAPLPALDHGPDSLERAIQAKADKGPRVTPADIAAEIASEFYFTAADGVRGELLSSLPELGVNFGGDNPLSLLTFCVLVLRNGTKVVGINYGAIDPAQHSAERGRQEARAQAVDKVYELLGFRLRDELARPVLTDADAAADLAGTPRPDNPTAEAADFLASVKACDLSGDAPCEACQ